MSKKMLKEEKENHENSLNIKKVPRGLFFENYWYIIQFQKGSNSHLIHTIVSCKEMVSVPKPKWNSRPGDEVEFCIHDGVRTQIVHILYSTDSYMEADTNLKALDKKCIEILYAPKTQEIARRDEWVLCQYYCGQNTRVYAIVHRKETILEYNDLRDDVALHISDGKRHIFQAMILRVNSDLLELDLLLRNLRSAISGIKSKAPEVSPPNPVHVDLETIFVTNPISSDEPDVVKPIFSEKMDGLSSTFIPAKLLQLNQYKVKVGGNELDNCSEIYAPCSRLYMSKRYNVMNVSRENKKVPKLLRPTNKYN